MKDFIIAAVKDELTDTFLQPVFGETKEELLRIFQYQINNIPLWKNNANDFSFYMLGTFNDSTGDIKPARTKIASGHSVLKPEEKQVRDFFTPLSKEEKE